MAAVKAIVIREPGGPEVLELRDIPEPIPGPEDLLVRVHATAVNRADTLQRQGQYPQPGPRTEFEVPGLEFAGEVLEAGPRTQGFAAGDLVRGLMGGGGYAEQLNIQQRLAVAVPERLSWNEAGSIPEVFVTAQDALLQCGLQAGETVLIHAAGSGVGVAAIQVAKLMGASLVIGTAGSEGKLKAAAELGLDVGIDYQREDFAEATLAATGGRGVDVVLDVIGGDYWERNLRALAPKGRMVMVGLMGGAAASGNLGLILGKRLQIRGTTLRARPLEEKAQATRAFEKGIVPHLASGRLRTVIDRVFPLAEAAAAHRHIEANLNFGKIVLEV